MRCPECGHDNKPGTRFCVLCGTPMPKEEPAEAAATLRCPQCGAEVQPDDRFCVMCGAVLSPSAAPAAPTAEVEPAPADAAGEQTGPSSLDAVPMVSAPAPPAREEPEGQRVKVSDLPEVGETYELGSAAEAPAVVEAEPAPAEPVSSTPDAPTVPPAPVEQPAPSPEPAPASPRYVAFCPNCGWRNVNDVHFCADCGADLTKGAPLPATAPSVAPAATPSLDATVMAQPVAPAPAAQAAVPAAGKPAQQDKKKKVRTPVIVAICVAAALLLGGGIAWKVKADQEQAAYEQAHRAIDVGLTIQAPNYTAGATRIPLHVTGTDLDGKSVDLIQYVSPDTPNLSLVQGDYNISVQASPILEDGSLYVVPETVVVVSLHDEAPQADATSGDTTSADAPAPSDGTSDGSDQADGQGEATDGQVTTDGQAAPDATQGEATNDQSSSDATSTPDPASQTITFAVADPTQVTDEMIAKAKEAAEGDDQSADKAEELAQKATQVRDDAVEAQKEAEAAAAAEAARQAKIQTVQENAVGFAKTYFGNVTLGSLITDAYGSYYETTDVPTWKSDVLKYVAPGSSAYSSLQSEEMGSLGFMDAWLACKSASVTQADETSATVSVNYYGGNGFPTPDMPLYHATVQLSFNDDGLITDASISYND